LTGPLAVALAVSIAGGLSAWYAGSTRIPFVAGFGHALPEALAVSIPGGVPWVALVTQGALSALFIAVTLAGSTVAEAYQIFLKASVVTTLVPFCYMFLGLVRLRDVGAWRRTAGAVGFAVSAIGALAAFWPTENVGSVLMFEVKLLIGALLPVAIGLACTRERGGAWLAERFSNQHSASDSHRPARRCGDAGCLLPLRADRQEPHKKASRSANVCGHVPREAARAARWRGGAR